MSFLLDVKVSRYTDKYGKGTRIRNYETEFWISHPLNSDNKNQNDPNTRKAIAKLLQQVKKSFRIHFWQVR